MGDTISKVNPKNISIDFPKTIQIEDVTKKEKKQSSLITNMPWIVALIIGLLSVLANYWVAHILRKSNERNLRSQIESNERSLKVQIESAKDTALTEFKATIATKNRQEWINELRNTLTEYLSSVSLILPTPENPSKKFNDEKSQLIYRMSLAKAKLELLMNREKAEQKELLNKIEEMFNVANSNSMEGYVDKMVAARSIVINAARKLFDIHWKKIKELK